MQECPRCGTSSSEGAFCSQCGAPLQPDTKKEDPKKPPLSKRQLRIFSSLLGLCALLLAGVLLLLVDGLNIYESTSAAQLPQANAEAYARPTPSPSPTPKPPAWRQLLGKWTASRVEINKNKVKPTVETEYVHGMQVEFLEDGVAHIRIPHPNMPEVLADRSYSVEGDSLYIEYGAEMLEDVEYYGRTRYFMKNGTLASVYLLDGREASDYMIFSLEGATLPETTAESAQSAED